MTNPSFLSIPADDRLYSSQASDPTQAKGTGILPNRACAVLKVLVPHHRLQAPMKPRCCLYPYRPTSRVQIHCQPCGEAMDQLLVAK